jgi:hypothetical protein
VEAISRVTSTPVGSCDVALDASMAADLDEMMSQDPAGECMPVPRAFFIERSCIHYTLCLSTADNVGASRVTGTTNPIDFAFPVNDFGFPRTLSECDTFACIRTFGYPKGTQLSVGPPLFGYFAALEQLVSGYVLVVGPTSIHALQQRPETVGDRVVHVIQIADDLLVPRRDMPRPWFHLPAFEEMYHMWLHPYHHGPLYLGALQHVHTQETRSCTTRQSTSSLPCGGFTFRTIQPPPLDRPTVHSKRHDKRWLPKVRMQAGEELEARAKWVLPPYPMFLTDIFDAQHDREAMHQAMEKRCAIWYEGDRHLCGTHFRVMCTPYLCMAEGVADVFIPQLLTTAQEQRDILAQAKVQGRKLPNAPRVYLGRRLSIEEAKLVNDAGFITTKYVGRGNTVFHRAVWPRCEDLSEAHCTAYKFAWDRQTRGQRPINRTLF